MRIVFDGLKAKDSPKDGGNPDTGNYAVEVLFVNRPGVKYTDILLML